MKTRLSTLTILLVLFASLILSTPTQNASAATATVTDIPNPDAYSCGQSGYINFEPMPDGTNLSSGAINGVQFTTTNGFTWLVGDFATGQYNGKYPNGGYTSQGTHWAWLGVSQGAGRIDFINGLASIFSLLVSDNLSPVQLDAYKADNTLLATAGPASINFGTGHMDELKITRDTADIAYVIVHDAGNFFLVDSICTNAPGVPNQALNDYKQNKNADGSDVPWAPRPMYNTTNCGDPNIVDNMAHIGCAVTSLTDVITSYNLKTLPDGSSADPGTLNNYLGLPSNVGTHSGCSIIWAPAGRVLNYTIHDYRPPSASYDSRIARIDEALAANNLVIFGIGMSQNKDGTWNLHFVVFYQKSPKNAPDGSPDYLIADPYRYPPYDGSNNGDRSGKTFSAAYGKSLKQLGYFQIEVVDNKAPQPGRAWAIVAHSPVEMLITDPNGAQTGFNPVTQSYVLDIPDSSYGPGDGIADDTGVNPAIPNVLYFGQNQLEDGVYKVQVIGTGAGPYTLDFAVASGPMNTSLQTIAGTAAPGQIDTYIVSVIEGQPIIIQRKVQIDIWPFINHNIVVLNKNHRIPVAILSTNNFSAPVDVNRTSLTFGKTGDEKTLEFCSQFKVDVNNDGLQDLLCVFRSGQTGFQLGDTEGILKGKTVGGLPIEGRDVILTIPDLAMRYYEAFPNGTNEVPPVTTNATASSTFYVNANVTLLQFGLDTHNLKNVNAIQIHCGAKGVNGPVGVTLFKGGPVTKRTFIGMILAPDPGNACGWTDLNDVVKAMFSGDTYINAHTTAFPTGEIRGQIASFKEGSRVPADLMPNDFFTLLLPVLYR